LTEDGLFISSLYVEAFTYQGNKNTYDDEKYHNGGNSLFFYLKKI